MAWSRILYNKYFLRYEFSKIYLPKIQIDFFFMILSRINRGVYLSLFEHANTRKHVYEHNCSSVRVFFSILAHLAHLAQFFFLILNVMNREIVMPCGASPSLFPLLTLILPFLTHIMNPHNSRNSNLLFLSTSICVIVPYFIFKQNRSLQRNSNLLFLVSTYF